MARCFYTRREQSDNAGLGIGGGLVGGLDFTPPRCLPAPGLALGSSSPIPATRCFRNEGWVGPVVSRLCHASWIANIAHVHRINFSERFLDDRLSAGDGHRRSGDIAGFIARKHNIDGGKLLWLGRTFHRDLLAKMLDLLGRHGGWNQRRPNRTGATALARMPRSASSWARPPVKFWMAPFVVA